MTAGHDDAVRAAAHLAARLNPTDPLAQFGRLRLDAAVRHQTQEPPMTYAPALAALLTDLRAADGARNPNLSAAGLKAQRDAARAAAFTRAHDTITVAADAARAAADKATARAHATLNAADDAVTLLRREQAWTQTRMLLDTGRDLADVIDTTDDPTTLAAIASWAPSWVAAQSPKPAPGAPFWDSWREPDVAWIGDAVVNRLTAVDPTRYPGVGPAIAEATRAGTYAGVVAELEQTGGQLSIAAKRALAAVDPDGLGTVQAAATNQPTQH
jgi:hypothetical protein